MSLYTFIKEYKIGVVVVFVVVVILFFFKSEAGHVLRMSLILCKISACCPYKLCPCSKQLHNYKKEDWYVCVRRFKTKDILQDITRCWTGNI